MRWASLARFSAIWRAPAAIPPTRGAALACTLELSLRISSTPQRPLRRVIWRQSIRWVRQAFLTTTASWLSSSSGSHHIMVIAQPKAPIQPAAARAAVVVSRQATAPTITATAIQAAIVAMRARRERIMTLGIATFLHVQAALPVLGANSICTRLKPFDGVLNLLTINGIEA